MFTAARELAEKLNQISQKVQAAREAADQKITSQVKTLNSALNTVKDLNDRILKLKQNNKDTSTLEDQRQKKIDEIADIIPIREVPKKMARSALSLLAVQRYWQPSQQKFCLNHRLLLPLICP